MDARASPWLEAVELSKRYGGVLALDRASFAARQGEVHGLVGANGAGKSTLVKCLTGIVRPTSGSVVVNGRSLSLGRPVESIRAGIASVPQELTVAPTLSVVENIVLGREPRGLLGWVRGRESRRQAEEVLASLSLDVRLTAPVGQLSLIEQRLVMIARALACRARLVIFDEPTATVSPHEAKLLLETVRGLAGRGVAVLYVSHHLREIEQVCDRVTVLRDGRVLADLERATHAELVGLLAPEATSRGRSPREERSTGEIVLDARSVTGPWLRDVSLVVGSGEIVGLAGLAGSGARELLLTVCGAVPFASGSITLGGRPLRSGDALFAVARGVGFLPGDRSLGTFPSHMLRHNVALPSLSRYARLGFIDSGAEKSAVAALLDRVALRASPESPITSLSGGNQQKALVARWIGSNSRLLLLDDPTAGVDVATRPEIHDQIRALSEDGVSVLLVSTDAEELAELSDRVVVFERGAVTAELTPDLLTSARVLAAMTGDVSTVTR
ncbi:MAG: sugar ABC transporter ATP-binding protein [Gaiellaceae bacterium]